MRHTSTSLFWKGHRVPVPGAGGFIGSYLAERLAALDANLRARRGRVVRIEEKPRFETTNNAGIYVLEPALIRQVPRRFSPITELFEARLNRGQPVAAFEAEEEWIDVGLREHLREGRVQGSPLS